MNLIFILALCSLAFSVTVSVPGHRELCFYETYEQNTTVSGSFHVTEGGNLKISARVTAPSTTVLYTIQDRSDGRFSFSTAEAGEYEICLDNRRSSTSRKTILHFMAEFSEETVFSDNPVEAEIYDIAHKLDDVRREQRLLQQWEQRLTNTLESTKSRVRLVSVLKTLLVVGISVAQMWLMAKAFSKRKTAA
eukprot:gnl/Dysnectes_brevis/1113_a1244_4589.p1 GENE.gnl/Dysnectes_brevis/1113_a1244_4589~~gnl/Dysnectes_brevis/1113_a1244_4589.p1  ORF type:complete len:192 (+),score=35.19 gnl/Dysnectes_brevis/1113_a1244_4589:36-611(+)